MLGFKQVEPMGNHPFVNGVRAKYYLLRDCPRLN